MFQGSFPLVLRVGALSWILFAGLTSGFMYLLNDEYGIAAWMWKIALALALCMGVPLLIASLICKAAPTSTLWRMSFAGVMLLPIVMISGTAGLSYLAAAPESVRPWLWFLMLSMTVLWCLISVSGYKQRVIDRRFMEREFSVEETRIVVRQPLKTDLDPEPISEQTFFGRLYHRSGPYLIFGVPLAYPLQRLVTDTAGGGATLLLLALFGFPLMLYVLGRMTCGAYLWIYKVWQMERQHGKPVVFADAR